MSKLPGTDDPPLDAERVEEAFSVFAERVRELEEIVNELRTELRALRADRSVPTPLVDEEWPAEPAEVDLGASSDWVAAVPPPLTMTSPAPRLVLEGAFLVAVALLAGLADLSAVSIALVMLGAWAIVALSEWAASARRARWRLEEVALPLGATEAALDTTGPWDVPVVQSTAIETADRSESRTVVTKLPPEPEPEPEPEPGEEQEADREADAEQTIAPASTPGRRLRFWRRERVEPTPDPWEA